MPNYKPAPEWTRDELLDLHDRVDGGNCRAYFDDDALVEIAREMREAIAAGSDGAAVEILRAAQYGDALYFAPEARRLAGIPDPVKARDAVLRAAFAWGEAHDDREYALLVAGDALVEAIKAARAAGVEVTRD